MIKAGASVFKSLPLFYEKGQAGETPHSTEILSFIFGFYDDESLYVKLTSLLLN